MRSVESIRTLADTSFITKASISAPSWAFSFTKEKKFIWITFKSCLGSYSEYEEVSDHFPPSEPMTIIYTYICIYMYVCLFFLAKCHLFCNQGSEMWGPNCRARNLWCHFTTAIRRVTTHFCLKWTQWKWWQAAYLWPTAGTCALVSKDQRGLHLLGHLLAAQCRDNGESKLEAGPRPPARDDQAVLLHAILRVAVMTLDEKRVTSWQAALANSDSRLAAKPSQRVTGLT